MVRTLVILAAVGFCLAGAAYAATRQADPEGGGRAPLRPRITVRPEAETLESVAEFDFAQPPRPQRKARPGLPLGYECRLDDDGWGDCVGPVSLTGITRGLHRFAVRAINHTGTEGPVTAFEWRRIRAPRSTPASEPTAPESAPIGNPPAAEVPSEKPSEPPVVPPVEPPIEPPATGLPFTIEQIGALEDLFPGTPAQTIDLRIENPNPVAISIVSLTASIATDPPGCPAEENFILTPAAVSAEAPLLVPAESTVALPSVGVDGPTIAMLELPTSQDACQAAQLQISLSGEATG